MLKINVNVTLFFPSRRFPGFPSEIVSRIATQFSLSLPAATELAAFSFRRLRLHSNSAISFSPLPTLMVGYMGRFNARRFAFLPFRNGYHG